MNEITDYLTEDHEHCDRLFAEAENAVDAGDWTRVAKRFAAFRQDSLRHFAREEGILFPAFEARTGMVGGPTLVMREEHEQMRNTLEAMAAAVTGRDAHAYLGLSETLLMLMRQHNMKEERILYPMADQAMPDGAALVARMVEVTD
ncbi:MAG: hemerythrin domain-containing protein [Hydrogenophilaceae bacterium]